MFVLSGKIQIGSYVFNQFTNVNVVKSVDAISQTATITLPTRFTLRGTNEKLTTEKSIKVGDFVSIICRYEDVLEEEVFQGYVTKIKPNVPLQIECEDVMYWLRKKNINQYFENITLKELIQKLVSEVKIQDEVKTLEISEKIPTLKFDKFLIRNSNAFQVLEKLKSDYGLTIYVTDDNKVYAGLEQTATIGKSVSYDFDKTMIAHDLEFRTEEQIKLKIKCVGFKPDNSKIEVEVGDTDGELRTFHYYNINNEKQLKELGETELKKYKVEGYKGSFTSFFAPLCKVGFKANLTDKNFLDREGSYFVPKVEIEFGVNGGRRKVYVSNKI